LEGGTFTRAQETTDPGKANVLCNLNGETYTLIKGEDTDVRTQIVRIAKRMSLESLTEAREAIDVK
jgi:hypothetical protein